jgi:solute:Na+ symporter, SSS family
MSAIDWVVLLGTLSFIVIYGTWKSRGSKNIEGYLKGNNEMKWYTIGLSVMATQASAITFLSTPGQAFEDGMRFIQFYFGLPLAMVIISVTFIPIFYRLKVYTAYEFLESRFDLKTRMLTAFLFLLQRGLAAGITIYAPAIILSTMLDWPLNYTNLFIGILVIIYTVSGGTKAVSQTQKQQMLVILAGMVIAFFIILEHISSYTTFSGALDVAGVMGKMNVIDFNFDVNSRYTIWSGLTGGLFLSLAYFGTDQSQVQRYLSGISIKESRLGLLFNGLLKIPMQFLILLTGVMVFVFYQFVMPPAFFNAPLLEQTKQSIHAPELNELETKRERNFAYKNIALQEFISAPDEAKKARAAAKIRIAQAEEKKIKENTIEVIAKANPDVEIKETDYVFISFILKYLPVGIVGLLLAVIFSAAMSSTSSELNALASTTIIDFYKRSIKPEASDEHYLKASKWFTAFWGVVAIFFASVASMVDNLIQAVNILGSIFYGTILGIFLSAFYIKKLQANAVFYAAIIAQAIVLILYWKTTIGFLWFNAIGCGLVISVAMILAGAEKAYKVK